MVGTSRAFGWSAGARLLGFTGHVWCVEVLEYWSVEILEFWSVGMCRTKVVVVVAGVKEMQERMDSGQTLYTIPGITRLGRCGIEVLSKDQSKTSEGCVIDSLLL